MQPKKLEDYTEKDHIERVQGYLLEASREMAHNNYGTATQYIEKAALYAGYLHNMLCAKQQLRLPMEEEV